MSVVLNPEIWGGMCSTKGYVLSSTQNFAVTFVDTTSPVFLSIQEPRTLQTFLGKKQKVPTFLGNECRLGRAWLELFSVLDFYEA
jgi:hypothetical protein